MRTLSFALLVIPLALSCATPAKDSKTELESYAGKIAAKIEPIWRAEVERRVKNLAGRGLAPIPLNAPQNQVLMRLAISEEGKLSGIETVKKSRYVFLNEAAVVALTNASPLSMPPKSCFKSGICTMEWRFIINR